jgi:2-methylfumaryl-CoA hydratase
MMRAGPHAMCECPKIRRRPVGPGVSVCAWSEVLNKAELPSRRNSRALRLRTVATKDRPCADIPYAAGDAYDPAVIFNFDYWVPLPR